MKLFEKMPSPSKRSARVLLATTIFALTLSGMVAAAFPINVVQNQNNVPASAKRYVGTWKGKLHPGDKIDQVLIFKIEGDRLTGTQREILYSREEDIGQNPESNQYVKLPELTMSGDAITWITKKKIFQNQEQETEMDVLNKVFLIGDDEMQVEKTGNKEWVDKNGRHKGASLHVGYQLKREK